MEHSEEHKAALARAVALDVPEAYLPSEYGTFQKAQSMNDSAHGSSSWDELAARILDTDEKGESVLKSDWY